MLDRTGVEPDQVGGDIGGRIAQLLMMAAFTRNMRGIKEALNLAESLVAAGTSHWPQLRTYLLATQHQEQVDESQFLSLKQQAPPYDK